MIYMQSENVNKFFELFKKEHRNIELEKGAKMFMEHDDFNKNNEFQLNFYVRNIMACYRFSVIEKIMELNPELDISWIGKEFNNYIVESDFLGRAFVYYKFRNFRGSLAVKSQYDNLLDINGMPAIINFRHSKFPNSTSEKGGIIRALFNRDVAYGMIVTRDRVGLNSADFKERGGIVIKLPFNNKTLKDRVRDVCEKYEFRILEDG